MTCQLINLVLKITICNKDIYRSEFPLSFCIYVKILREFECSIVRTEMCVIRSPIFLKIIMMMMIIMILIITIKIIIRMILIVVIIN